MLFVEVALLLGDLRGQDRVWFVGGRLRLALAKVALRPHGHRPGSLLGLIPVALLSQRPDGPSAPPPPGRVDGLLGPLLPARRHHRPSEEAVPVVP